MNKAFAVNLSFETPKDHLNIGEQFYVDLILDAKDQSVNTIKGNVTFDDSKITFVRAENYKSIFTLWLEEPNINKNTINFIGLVPNGFEGSVDPFNPSKKLPGLVTRLVFEAKKTGKIDFSTGQFYLNLNDGLGTEVEALPAYLSLFVDNFEYKTEYEDEGVGLPTLDAYIIRDPNIYNNKYILIFKAYDKDSGIKNVLIKEGWWGWREVDSPYLLKDQSRHSDISLQANSNKGVSVIVKINKIPRDYRYLVVVVSILIVLFLIYEKRSIKNKMIKKV
ncbi:MAG: hypothetical protein WCR20_01205 [Verrucomicrobiota bacterium]